MATLHDDSIPTISPVLFYKDLAHASSWLQHAFGFEERMKERVTFDSGEVVHAELALGNGMVILSSAYDAFEVPGESAVHHQCLYVSISDAVAHKARSLEGGAKLVSDIRDTDYGARVYAASDLAGYHWIFAETL